MTLQQERQTTVDAAIGQMKSALAAQGDTRAGLAEVLEIVKRLAARKDFWSEAEFAPPAPGALQARYLIREDPQQTYALYLNVMRPGKKGKPHNHTTWACIAAVEGAEHNHLYRRTDDGATPGVGTLEKTDTIVVDPGHGIALAAADIHAVEIRGDTPIRHLHMYGRSLDALTERITFDLATGRYEIMDIGVHTRR